MMILALIGTALLSLRHHALRSTLTMLGIIFGVAAVVAMTAISEGARYQSLQEVENMGLDKVLIRSKKPPLPKTNNEDSANRYIATYGITTPDREHITKAVPGVVGTIAARELGQKLWAGDQRVNAQIHATEPRWFEAAKLSLRRGRFISELDCSRHKAVAAIGQEVAREIFRYRDPIGKTVKIGNEWFTVIGVVDRASGGGGGQSGDEISHAVFLPHTVATSRFGIINAVQEVGSMQYSKVEISTLVVAIGSEGEVVRAGELIRRIMLKTHPKNDYEVIVPRELLAQKQRTQRIFTIVMGSIASISLIVGGIGIMNIMLATVLERTREIGIRRAIGATRRNILAQFLTETVVLSVIGGLGGLLLGVAGAVIVSSLSDWPTLLSPWSMALAVGISGVVGVAFGLYPAAMAARMQPVEALRSA
jgi:putative ABC transport system permease protein